MSKRKQVKQNQAKRRQIKKQRRAKLIKARLAAQQARLHEPPEYEGYLKMFLDDDSIDSLIDRVVRTGDWLTVPNEIFKRDRVYKFTLNAVSKDGQRAHANAQVEGEHDYKALVAAVTASFNDFYAELIEYAPGIEVDLKESHVVIRAIKTKVDDGSGGTYWA